LSAYEREIDLGELPPPIDGADVGRRPLGVATSAVNDGAELTGSIALVTGAGRGIGRAIALTLAGAGASVALCARSTGQLADVAAEIVAGGGTAISIPADITREGAAEAVVSDVEREFGPLNTLINAAGVSPVYTAAERIEASDYDVIMATNVRAPFQLAQAAGVRMLERGNGSIVNITSIGGVVALPRLAAYCAAKAALNSLTRVLAVEWASRGVRVNAVAPAYVETAMTSGLISHETLGPALLASTPLGRFAQPGDIVGIVRFLASDAASYITGQTIGVDGGWTAQ
jgi:NAD(P)-dependent dehydrogenase (short-subunit alcohol dehydrogenase family)